MNGFSRRAALTAMAAATASPTLGAVAEKSRRRIGIASRHLQWTGMEDAIAVAREIGFDCIEWGVRPGSHVEPARVAQDLPRAIALTRQAGMEVEMISPILLDLSSPEAQTILETAAIHGVHIYRPGNYYQWSGPAGRLQQLDMVRRRMASLQPLHEKLGMAMAYHNHAGEGLIGGNLWDLLYVLRDFDPRWFGFDYDTGHGVIRNGDGWRDAMLAAQPWLKSLAVKDCVWRKSASGWDAEFVPVGTGMVNVSSALEILDGGMAAKPVNLQIEHHNLLGDAVGKFKLPMSRQNFIRILRQDLDYVRKVGAEAASAKVFGNGS